MSRIARETHHRALSGWLLVLVAMVLSCHGAASYIEPWAVSITLERTRCYGTCPAYIVTVLGDGSVKYFGKYYVDIPGAQTAKIQPARVEELLRAFEKIHFFDLKDRYVDDCTDGPTEVISLAMGGRSKRIENYFCYQDKSGPKVDLMQLAEQIDAVSNGRQWIQCDAGCLNKLISS